MRTPFLILISWLIQASPACSGTADSGSDTGSAGVSSRGGSPAGGRTGASGGSGGAGVGGDAAAGANGGPTGGTSSGSGGASQCPNVFAEFTVQRVAGTCGDLAESAPQSIEGTSEVCALHFVSVPDSGSGAINGGAALSADGTFADAHLYLGSVQRSPCGGAYDSSSGAMTVTCGGPGDQCTVVLTPPS